MADETPAEAGKTKTQLLPTWAWAGAAVLALLVVVAGFRSVQSQKALETANSALKVAQEKVSAAEEAAKDLKAKLDGVMAENGKLKSDVEKAQAERSVESGKLAQLKSDSGTEIEQLKTALQKANGARDDVQAMLDAAKSESTKLKGELDSTRSVLRGEADALKGQLAEAQARIEKLSGMLETAKAERNAIQAKLETASTEIAKLNNAIAAATQTPSAGPETSPAPSAGSAAPAATQ